MKFSSHTATRCRLVNVVDRTVRQRQHGCNVHSRDESLHELKAYGLQVIEMTDLTARTLPYWKLRRASTLATGVEDAFIEAYEEGSFHYLLIAADRLP